MTNRPGRLSWAELTLAMAAPADRAGFTSRRMVVDGVRTHVRVAAGPSPDTAGPPVVLLHGLAVSHRYLMPTARVLATVHPTYVPDLPGFGRSGKPWAVWSPTRHADHVARMLDHLGTGPVCVLGHSFGAEVAAALASRHPDAVTAVVLAGPTSDPAARSYRGLAGRWLLDLLTEDPRQAVILARDLRDAGPRRVFGSLRHSVHNAIEADLDRVKAPVLVVRGGRDPISPRRWVARAAEICAGPAVTWEVPRAGHNLATTAGAQLAALVTRFIDDGRVGASARVAPHDGLANR